MKKRFKIGDLVLVDNKDVAVVIRVKPGKNLLFLSFSLGGGDQWWLYVDDSITSLENFGQKQKQKKKKSLDK